jgi:hypothetical protein
VKLPLDGTKVMIIKLQMAQGSIQYRYPTPLPLYGRSHIHRNTHLIIARLLGRRRETTKETTINRNISINLSDHSS